MTTTTDRLSSGIPRLDEALGGGYLPGSLVMIIGATGVGKTQLGMHFVKAGDSSPNLSKGETTRGAIIDLSSRGDSQNHTQYYQRLFGETLAVASPEDDSRSKHFAPNRPNDVLMFLGYSGRRVLRSQMDVDQWHSWQSEMNRRTPQLFWFVYNHLVHGTRRFVIDGIEPIGGNDDSLQMDIVELLYHRMLRAEHDWLAREVLRESFREHATQVMELAYDHTASTALTLVTTKQSMLEQLMTEPLSDGDIAAGANTIILLGRQLIDGQMKRALYVAKHRGSFAEQSIIPFDIGETGLLF